MDFVTTDLLKEIISEIDLDIDGDAAMQNIMNAVEKKDEKK